MTRTVKVKICGIRDVLNLDAAIRAGADFIGFVFYPSSPRAVGIEDARVLVQYIKDRGVSKHVLSVGLFVDPDDGLLEDTLSRVSLDIIQLHGSETSERVRAIRERYNLPVIKALAASDEIDFNIVRDYEAVADWLLFDAKPAPGGQPGGMGVGFDWSILVGHHFSKPWMLSGGLNAGNVREALGVLCPDAVDVSSGVESSRGIKDAGKIREFISLIN